MNKYDLEKQISEKKMLLRNLCLREDGTEKENDATDLEIESLKKQLLSLSKRLDVLEGEEPDADEQRAYDRHPAVIRSRGRVSRTTQHLPEQRKFNVGNAIRSITENKQLSGYEAEVTQELSRGRRWKLVPTKSLPTLVVVAEL